MKKNTTVARSPKRAAKSVSTPITIGLDLGDKNSRYCLLSEAGDIVREDSVATTKSGLQRAFGAKQRYRIAIEVGTHSPWVSRLLTQLGHEVFVANARQMELISHSSRKDDRLDAQLLARLARVDPQLLRPIRHRSEKAHLDLMVVRTRAVLLETRTTLVNAARGLVKPLGLRLPVCDADNLNQEKLVDLPEPVQRTIRPLLETIESLTTQIKELDARIEQIARNEYPETDLLRQVSGVGPLIALTFVLTVEDKNRFQHSREVGSYIGLRPKRSESGESQPQLRITKEGDAYLRQLLVQGAHFILGFRGPDTDLRRWGNKLAARGGKNAKKRAVVAVARKLAVLLHRLWVTGEVYEPLRNSQTRVRQNRTAA